MLSNLIIGYKTVIPGFHRCERNSLADNDITKAISSSEEEHDQDHF